MLLAAAAWSAAADEVMLRNGDRLRGEVVELKLAEIAYINPKPYESGIGAHYTGHLTLSAAYMRGNTQDQQINGDGELAARARQYRYALTAKVDRRDEAAAAAATAWLGGANYDRFVEERRFIYVRGSLEHDRAKDVDLRSAAGAGYGAQLIETPRASFSLRGGLDYVTVERFAAPHEGYPAFGWGVKAAYSPWFHEHEGFWNLEDTQALLVRSKTGLRLPLVERLSASLQLNVDWERRSAPGRRSTDSTLLLGVNYSW